LELHTGDLERARAFVCELLQWREDRVDTPCGAYRALDLGAGVGGGIVECGARPALWLPYVQVEQVCDRTARAVELGARVLLDPREGPAGWRSVIATPEAGQIALWQQKEWR
jgi:predicted enzyme related to lactoylglutathione lyase